MPVRSESDRGQDILCSGAKSDDRALIEKCALTSQSSPSQLGSRRRPSSDRHRGDLCAASQWTSQILARKRESARRSKSRPFPGLLGRPQRAWRWALSSILRALRPCGVGEERDRRSRTLTSTRDTVLRGEGRKSEPEHTHASSIVHQSTSSASSSGTRDPGAASSCSRSRTRTRRRRGSASARPPARRHRPRPS